MSKQTHSESLLRGRRLLNWHHEAITSDGAVRGTNSASAKERSLACHRAHDPSAIGTQGTNAGSRSVPSYART